MTAALSCATRWTLPTPTRCASCTPTTTIVAIDKPAGLLVHRSRARRARDAQRRRHAARAARRAGVAAAPAGQGDLRRARVRAQRGGRVGAGRGLRGGPRAQALPRAGARLAGRPKARSTTRWRATPSCRPPASRAWPPSRAGAACACFEWPFARRPPCDEPLRAGRGRAAERPPPPDPPPLQAHRASAGGRHDARQGRAQPRGRRVAGHVAAVAACDPARAARRRRRAAARDRVGAGRRVGPRCCAMRRAYFLRTITLPIE